MRSSQISRVPLFEKIIAVLNYISFGLVGFIYIILVALKQCRLTPFLQYHIFLTFFLTILYFLITVMVKLFVAILSIIPFLNILVLKLLFYFNAPIFLGQYSIVTGFIRLFQIYLCTTSFLGIYSYVPYASKIIMSNVRR